MKDGRTTFDWLSKTNRRRSHKENDASPWQRAKQPGSIKHCSAKFSGLIDTYTLHRPSFSGRTLFFTFPRIFQNTFSRLKSRQGFPAFNDHTTRDCTVSRELRVQRIVNVGARDGGVEPHIPELQSVEGVAAHTPRRERIKTKIVGISARTVVV